MTDKQETHELALINLTKAIELNPNDAVAYFSRANDYNEQNNYGLALADYNKAIKLNPNYTEAYKGRSLCYEKQEEHKLSSDDMKNAFMLELGFEPIDYELSLANYTKVIESDPNNATSYFSRANFYNTQKEYDLALVDFTKAIELNPNYAFAYCNRGICHYKQENYKLALDDFTKAIELAPDFNVPYSYRANYYYKQENYKLALDDYTKLINFAPNDDSNAYYSRAKCYIKQENYQLALDDFTKAIEICENLYLDDIFTRAPHNDYYGRAFCYYKLEKYSLSLTDIDNAIKFCNSLEIKSRYCLSANTIACSAKKYSKAKDYIEQAFENADSIEQKHKDIYFKEIDKTEKLEEKNKELNNLIAMFAHNFLGTLQCIRSNAEHDNNAKIHLKTVKMMSGALTAFSIISADDDKLIEQLKQDNTGETNLLQNLANNLALAISQLLSKTNKAKIINLYLNYLCKTNQIDKNTTSAELSARENRDYRKKWQALQHQWEDEFNALFSENVELSSLQVWLADNFFPVQITGFDNYNIRFKEYDITYSIFLIIFMEILVNALKYMDVSKNQPLKLTLCKQDQYYHLICENPSSQETYRGTHKGMDFLKSIARKLNAQFITESTEQQFKTTFIIPAELLD
ncbi:MAG: tetratricopeptide repeat protein [Methylococcales bacterium]|nr:tetratricopeptide repeat protein [Methylococcales bacterium]